MLRNHNIKIFLTLVFIFLVACQPYGKQETSQLAVTEQPTKPIAKTEIVAQPTVDLNNFDSAEITSENASNVVEIATLDIRPSSEVDSLAFSPNGELLAIQAYKSLLVWSINKNQLLKKIDNVANFAFSPNNQLLFTQSYVQKNNEIKIEYQIWNTNTWTLVKPTKSGIYNKIEEVAFSPDGKAALVFLDGNSGGTYAGYGWYPDDENSIISYSGSYLGLSPEGKILALYNTYEKYEVSFHDLETREMLCQYPSTDQFTLMTGISAEKRIAAIVLNDMTKLIKLNNCKEYLALKDANSIAYPVFIGNSQYLAGFQSSSIYVWNLNDGTRSIAIPSKLTNQTTINSFYLYSMFTLDGQVVASSGHLYNVSNGEIVNQLENIAQNGSLIQFSPNRHWLAVPGKDGKIHLFTASSH